MIQFVLKGVGWLLGIAALVVAVIFGINATDEELSPQTLAALKVPPPPEPSESNGYLDYLALGAPEDAPAFETGVRVLARYNDPSSDSPWAPPVRIDSRIPRCEPVKSSCLDTAANTRELQELLDGHQVFLRRYWAMRLKPVFVDLDVGTTPEGPILFPEGLHAGQQLSLLHAALRFNAGDRSAAIAELAAEVAFNRKVASGSRTLLHKLFAFARLDRAALFAAELARRIPAKEDASWRALQALLAEPAAEELDMIGALKLERATIVEWMRTRRYVRLSEGEYEAYKALGEEIARPWWDPIAPYLYRPNQSVNRFVAQSEVTLQSAALPSAEFLAGIEVLRDRARGFQPHGIARWVVNVAGNAHPRLQGYDGSEYVGRAHGHAGVQTLVRYLVRLRAEGISGPAALLKALDGPIGRAYVNPFSGKPMRFYPGQNAIGFEVPQRYLSAPVRPLWRDGRVTIPL